MANNDNRGFRYKLDNDIDRYANLTEARNTVTGVNERTKFAFIVSMRTLYLFMPRDNLKTSNAITSDSVVGISDNTPWIFDTIEYVLVGISGQFVHSDFAIITGKNFLLYPTLLSLIEDTAQLTPENVNNRFAFVSNTNRVYELIGGTESPITVVPDYVLLCQPNQGRYYAWRNVDYFAKLFNTLTVSGSTQLNTLAVSGASQFNGVSNTGIIQSTGRISNTSGGAGFVGNSSISGTLSVSGNLSAGNIQAGSVTITNHNVTEVTLVGHLSGRAASQYIVSVTFTGPNSVGNALGQIIVNKFNGWFQIMTLGGTVSATFDYIVIGIEV